MNKERQIYIGIIIILLMALAMTLVLFAQFNNETWHEVATTLSTLSAIIVPTTATMMAPAIVYIKGNMNVVATSNGRQKTLR